MAKIKNIKTDAAKERGSRSVRASVSFPMHIYLSLEAIARRKKVSLAWVVRDAAEQYVEKEVNEERGSHFPNDIRRKRERFHSS